MAHGHVRRPFFALAHLRDASDRFDGEIDFLVASHEVPDQPRLIKVSAGSISEGLDTYWIGNQASARALARMKLEPIQGESGSEYYSLEERQFTRRFHEYVDNVQDPFVGGMVINCLASPFGHCCQDHLGVYAERVTIPDPLSPELRAEMNKAGMNGHYSYAVLAPQDRGVAIVGTFFQQAGVGFLQDPLELDDPEKILIRTQEEFQAIIAERSRIRGRGAKVG